MRNPFRPAWLQGVWQRIDEARKWEANVDRWARSQPATIPCERFKGEIHRLDLFETRVASAARRTLTAVYMPCVQCLQADVKKRKRS